MGQITLLVGTTLGNSEYVADEMAEQLQNEGHKTEVLLQPDLTDLPKNGYWILVCSTHGAGDPPDNITPFLQALTEDNPDLSQIKLAVCAIGDSSYDTFCLGAEKLEQALLTAGATSYVDKIQIDVQQDPVPEEPALAWLSTWQDRIS